MSSDWIGYVAVIGVILFIVSRMKAGFDEGANPDDHKMHCIKCGSQAVPNDITKGTMLVEFLLWCLFIIPGLVYSIWRRTNGRKACSVCGSEDLIPTSAPAAQRTK